MIGWGYWFWAGLLALMLLVDFLLSRNKPRISILGYLKDRFRI